MIRYKIRLFSHLGFKANPKDYCFLFFSSSLLDSVFKDLETLKTRTYLKYTYNAFDEEEDLDLFKAKTIQKKLTDLGVDCAIVKVDYERQAFEQID